MAINPLTQFLFSVFITIAVIVTLYTCNFYYLVFLSRQRRKSQKTDLLGTPIVTIQLPIYNERYVAARLVNSVCSMDYPKEKMCIQVLDDSDDDTYDILENLIQDYKKKGFDISHIRRENRKGYKAGALRNAMKFAKGNFIAIFDADFIPPSWFLKKAIPYFAQSEIGLIQCKWGHVNEKYSALTQAQALSLDFHFLIEQKAKSNSHLYMSFNGTAGIWRKECIEDAGGWHTATLVEDLDLSYRAQMKGWKCLFLPDIVVDAELPVQMNAAKRQQFRWAKGSIQCAIKLMGDVVVKKIPFDTKIQAFVQLTRHIVHPLMLIQFLILPILLQAKFNLYVISVLPLLTIVAYLAMGPLVYIMIIRNLWQQSWKSKTLAYFYLLFYSAGMSVNNTVAVFDALLGKKNEFLRTPKYGIVKKSDDWRDKAYNLPFTKTTLLEIFFGIYGVLGIFVAIFSGNPVFVPLIALQTLGFIYISYLSVSHTTFKKNKSRSLHNTSKAEKMANAYYKLAMVGIVGFIAFGAFMAYYGYQNDVYPLDQSRGLLDRIQATSDPQTIIDDLKTMKILLPEDGNPVWIFPTETTDFGRIQDDIDTMILSVEKISTVPQDSSSFHTGMLDVHERAFKMRLHLMDATPYMYVSFSNIVFSCIWIAAIMGIFTMLKRKKDRLKAFEMSDEV
ncbi:MAG TPA: cellulose synthase family protein [Nitrosopumilaceae archaeon]|nr:cellulose synthase family protein [Nitrosopumilaceae archaeon]